MRRPGLLVGEVTVGMFGEPGLPQADGRRSPVRIDYRKRVGKRARELGQHFTAAVNAVGREVTVYDRRKSRAAGDQQLRGSVRGNGSAGRAEAKGDFFSGLRNCVGARRDHRAAQPAD